MNNDKLCHNPECREPLKRKDFGHRMESDAEFARRMYCPDCQSGHRPHKVMMEAHQKEVSNALRAWK